MDGITSESLNERTKGTVSARGVTRPSPLTRVVSALLVPFLVIAGVLLYAWPDRTDTLWAWTIRPTLTALLMGAGYFAGAYFFTRVAMGASWVAVKLGFLPIAAFAWLSALHTLIHLDRFHAGHASFLAWAALYAVTPFVVPALWWFERRRSEGAQLAGILLPRAVVVAVGAAGAGLTALGLILWLLPGAMMPLWPWALTPLTSRVVGSWFVLSGLVDLGIAMNRRWRDSRIPLHTQLIGLALILLGILRALADLNRDSPWSIGFTALIALTFAGVLLVTLAMERRSARRESV